VSDEHYVDVNVKAAGPRRSPDEASNHLYIIYSIGPNCG